MNRVPDRLPLPPPVPAEAREVALTTPPPRMWHEASTWTDDVERTERLATMREYGSLRDDLRALDRLYHATDCAGCGAPDGVPCVDDECSGHADPDAYESF